MASPTQMTFVQSQSPSPMISPTDVDIASPDLTPRSKVKALLANIDDEHSDENDGEAEIASRTPTRQALGMISGNRQFHWPPAELKKPDPISENADSSDDSFDRPHGRLAAGMLASGRGRAGSEEGNEEQEDDSAYARVRKRLKRAGSEKAETTDRDRQRETNVIEPAARSSQPLSEQEVDSSNLFTTPPKHGFIQPASPGLFLSPSSSHASPSSSRARNQSVEAPSTHEPSPKNNKLLELVAKKRAQREAREAEEEKRLAEKLSKKQNFAKMLSDDASASSNSEDDAQSQKRLTQATRPARKASKKALEEMNRETQRMNRNMQLAHQARTKKKISKDSLFARFNFHGPVTEPKTQSRSTTNSSIPASDTEDPQSGVSPPTSPAEVEGASEAIKPQDKDALTSTADLHPSYASIDDPSAMKADSSTEAQPREELGRRPKSSDQPKAFAAITAEEKTKPKGNISLQLAESASAGKIVDLDSDSEPEAPIANTRKKQNKANLKLVRFRPLTGKRSSEGRSLLALRALANLHSPEAPSKRRKVSINLGEMQQSLQRRARQQALEERNDKIEELKARGVYVHNAEDREKDQIHVEDMLERARKEAEEIKKKEKIAKKMAKGDPSNGGLLENSSDDEDEDYSDQQDNAEIELSGSEDQSDVLDGANQEMNADEDEDDETDNPQLSDTEQSRLIEEEAEESASGEEGADEADDEGDGDDVDLLPRPHRTGRARPLVVDDDDDEEGQETENNDAQNLGNQLRTSQLENESLRLTNTQLPQLPTLLGNLEPAKTPFGLTQAFQATMADTQNNNVMSQAEDSIDLYEKPPEPDLPIFDHFNNDTVETIMDSQNLSERHVSLEAPETGGSGFINLQFSLTEPNNSSLGSAQVQSHATQLTQIPDPTQDAGFDSSPQSQRFGEVPASTVETILLSGPMKDVSPLKKKGRLRRRQAALSESEAEDETNLNKDKGPGGEANAFAVMKEKRARAAAQIEFDKKKSEAKDMVEEQAQESEDEYAGLGGASDDESGGDGDEDVQKMLDHDEIDVDEGALAALHADKERISDEKAIEKLYKDINNGGLRRKRGAGLDLSDSEDDAEARRRRKQREFAKMRKALLADEKVGQIAEDPRKLAFLRAIEDRENDEDLDFLDRPAEGSTVAEGSTQDLASSHSQQLGDSISEPNLKRKRPLEEINPNMRPPPAARRTNAINKKPSTLAEIRESVSFLVELPGAMQAPDPSSSASEPEEDENESAMPSKPQEEQHHHPRRTPANAFIDRLSLKRASSTSTSTSTITTSISASSTRLAFYTPGSSTSDGFKVPSLLRRATTQLTGGGGAGTDSNGISYGPATSTERGTGAGGASDREGGSSGGGFGAMRKGSSGGGKKSSSVNCFAREMERRTAVALVEDRKRSERERKAKERREGGLGRLIVGGSGFD